MLIGQGYAPDNLKVIPADVLELAKVKSGYEQSKAQYESAQYDMEQATLTAPFDGVIANLFEKRYNMPKTSEPFCRVINAGNMEVDFTVLENELPLLKVGIRWRLLLMHRQQGCAREVSVRLIRWWTRMEWYG